MKSIVSYPERGEGGRNSYRGNCSPKLIEDLIDQFHIAEICDYMAGSYTTQDAAAKKGIISHCYDLNHGFDLMSMEIPERSEFTFWHPPYWDMVVYSGNQYSSEEVEQNYGFNPEERDLSRIKNWDDFVIAQNECTMKLFSALEKGGRLAILMGDIKRKGKLYSQICEIVKPGTIENIVIKAQHNCWSDSRTYSNYNFIPIEHEYLLILRKDQLLHFPYLNTVKRETDIRNMRLSTWRDVVYAVMKNAWEKEHRPLSLEEIYGKLEGHRKTDLNPNWRAKIRQILNSNPEYVSTQRGFWALAAA